jgi:LmbE family N-acetylglucosaminyl deacetylase
MLPAALGKDTSSPLSILCIGAHSDDIEIGCGATVLRLLSERAGCSVRWVVLSATAGREREARASAADFLASAAEATVSVTAFRESYFPYLPEIKDYFEELKRTTSPDVVFCHHRQDLHQDHRVVAELTWNTFRSHLIAEYEIPKYEGDLGTPNLYVPIPRPLAERKVELLLRHFVSQSTRSWFRAETFRGLMAIRGVECNAPDGHAEAFTARKIVL